MSLILPPDSLGETEVPEAEAPAVVLSPTTATPSPMSSRAGAGNRAFRAAAVLSVLYALSKLTGLVQMSVINTLLPPADADAYQAAFSIPDFVNYLVAGGALSATFIPIFTDLERNEDPRQAERFFGALFGVMGVLLAVLIGFCWIFATPLTHSINPGFSPAKLALTVRMTRVMLPAQWFFYMGGLFFALLNARKRFGVTGWTGAVYNLVAILVGVSLWFLLGFGLGAQASRDAHATTGFAWGIFAGAVVGSFLLPLTAYFKLEPDLRPALRPNFEWQQPAMRRFFRNVLPIMLGVSLPVVDIFILKYFASKMGDGEMNRLISAYRVMLAPLAILAQAASVAAFPFLAEEGAARDYQKLADFVRSGLRRLLFITLPMTVILMLEARPIINLLFGYGKFREVPQAVPETAFALQLFCLGLFAWGGQQLVARGFYALQDTRTPTIIGSILSVFFVGLCAFMARWGIAGLAVATTIGATSHFLGVTIALNAKLRRRPFRARLGTEKIIGGTLRTLVACGPMAGIGLGVAAVARGLLPTSKSGDLAQILLVGVLSSLAFAGAAQIIGVPEWTWLRKKLLKR